MNERGFKLRVPVGSRIVISPYRPDRLWARSVSYTVGTEAFSPVEKLSEREADHLPSTSAEFEKTWIHTSTPL
jgi:hypothetical protein